MSAAQLPQIDYPRDLIGGLVIEFDTVGGSGDGGLRRSYLRTFCEVQPNHYELRYVQGDEWEKILITARDGAVSGVVLVGNIRLPIKRLDLITIVEDLRMMLRKRRAQMPEAVRVLNEMWSMASAPEAPAGLEEPHEPLELIAVVEAPTQYGPYLVNKLTLDGEDLEELLIEHGGRELSITRTDDGYACEWSDDWSPAPKVVAISLLLNLGEHTPDDEVAIACDAAAGMIEGNDCEEPEDDDGDDIVAEVLEELTAATLEAGRGSHFEPALAAEAIALFSGEQASIIDVPEPKAEPVSRAAIIPLGWLTLDERCQPRTGIDEATVQRYVEALQSGAKLPPIEVVASIEERPIWVVDGWHRVEAHRRLKRNTIMAIRHKGELRDAIWRALAANSTNGLQRTQADLARAIGIALDDPEWAAMSDRALAKHVGCSDKTITRHKRLRQEAAERESKKPETPQEALATSAEIRTPAETTRHEVIERTTTTAAPERCGRTLDLVEMLGAPSTPAAAPEVSMIDAPEDAPSSDERYTPRDVIETARLILGGIGLDPASAHEAQEVVKAKTYWTSEHDALARDWGAVGARTVWLNPPYSRQLIAPFAKKFLEELDAESFEEALVLVNASVCATWWQDLARRAQLIAYPPSRLAFRQPGTGEQRGNLYDSSMMFFGAPEDAPHVRATLRSCDWLVTSGGGV